MMILGGFFCLWIKPWLVGYHHWRQAHQALVRGEFQPAAAHLGECLKTWPRDAATHFLLAQTYRRGDDLVAWQNQLKEAKLLGWPADAIELEDQLTLAQCGALGQVEAALLARLNSDCLQKGLICEALAKGYLQTYRLKDILRCTALWQQLEPSNWQPPFYRGQALELHNNFDYAIAEYRAALSLQPDEARVSFRLATVLAAVLNFDEALKLYQTRLEMEPTHAGALLGAAHCQHGLGRSEAALVTLDRLLALDGGHAGALYLRGQVELQLDRPLLALASVRNARALKPHDPEVLYTLVQCLRRLGRHAEADRHAKEFDSLLSEQQRLADLKHAIADRPRDISLRHEVGRYFQARRQYADAVRWYQTILQIDPGQRPAHESLAACFEQIGDHTHAASHRRAAAGALP
jgi:tetratricopeptide (TPR) repeat protein